MCVFHVQFDFAIVLHSLRFLLLTVDFTSTYFSEKENKKFGKSFLARGWPFWASARGQKRYWALRRIKYSNQHHNIFTWWRRWSFDWTCFDSYQAMKRTKEKTKNFCWFSFSACLCASYEIFTLVNCDEQNLFQLPRHRTIGHIVIRLI